MEIVPFHQLRISQHSSGPEAEELKLKISQLIFGKAEHTLKWELGIMWTCLALETQEAGAGDGEEGALTQDLTSSTAFLTVLCGQWWTGKLCGSICLAGKMA